MSKQDFSGVWHSVYHYKHPGVSGLQDSEHDVNIFRRSDQLIIESLPNEENSYLIMRMRIDGRLIAGTWEEHTSPTGVHKSEIYVGAAQFILSEDGNTLDGMLLSADERNFVKSNYRHIKRRK